MEFSHSGNGPNDVLVSSFGLMNRFTVLHLTIKSKNDKVGSAYTLSYSSGDRQVDLQDGLILDYTLDPNKETSFYYSSSTSSHIYLTVSLENSSDLSKLGVKMQYCEDAERAKTDDDCWK